MGCLTPARESPTAKSTSRVAQWRPFPMRTEKNTETTETIWVTAAQLTRLCEGTVSKSLISRLTHSGWLVRRADGKYDLFYSMELIQKWFCFRQHG